LALLRGGAPPCLAQPLAFFQREAPPCFAQPLALLRGGAPPCLTQPLAFFRREALKFLEALCETLALLWRQLLPLLPALT
jgi:hypothetical protein